MYYNFHQIPMFLCADSAMEHVLLAVIRDVCGQMGSIHKGDYVVSFAKRAFYNTDISLCGTGVVLCRVHASTLRVGGLGVWGVFCRLHRPVHADVADGLGNQYWLDL